MYMTKLTGTITDSGGVALDGTLTFTVPSARSHNTSIQLPAPHVFSIVAGVVDIDIPPGPYRVQFEDTSSTTYWDVETTLGEDDTTIDMLPGLVLEDRYNLALNLVAKVLVEQYIDRLKAGFIYKGVYDQAVTYELNQWVNYFGSSYLHIGTEPTTGINPLVFPVWALIASKGDIGPPGVGTTGSLEPFGVSWIDSTMATAQGAVYDELLTKSPVDSPTFTGTVSAPTPADPAEDSTLVATCEWVNDYTANLPRLTNVATTDLVVMDQSTTVKVLWGQFTTPVINRLRGDQEVYSVTLPYSVPNKLAVVGNISTIGATGGYYVSAGPGVSDTTIQISIVLGRPTGSNESVTVSWVVLGY